MFDLIGILIFAAIAWLVYDSAKTKTIASKAANIKCQAAGVQFLDQTVALNKIRVKRNLSGSLMLVRIYSFEYSESGAERQSAFVRLKGSEVQDVVLGQVLEDTLIS